MKDVLIRDLDEDVLKRLKRRAERHGRSLQAELKRIVEGSARVDEEDFWTSIDELRESLAASGESFEDSVRLMREDRER